LKTGPEYSIELYETGEEDYQKYDAIFTVRNSHTTAIHKEVKDWVAANIERWKDERPAWFNIEEIDDIFLSKDVLEAAGGVSRRRSSARLQEVTGLVLPPVKSESTKRRIAHRTREYKEEWVNIAEIIYKRRNNNHKSNFNLVKRVFSENEELLAPLLLKCPKIKEILSFILEDRFGFRVEKVDSTIPMDKWGAEQCRRVGCSFAAFIRSREKGDIAIEVWRREYMQVSRRPQNAHKRIAHRATRSLFVRLLVYSIVGITTKGCPSVDLVYPKRFRFAHTLSFSSHFFFLQIVFVACRSTLCSMK